VYLIGHVPESLILIGFFLLLAFPVHEFCHAFAAVKLGDMTPRFYGKYTLNPIKHFHPIGGTLLVISVVLFGQPLGFAATPVNPSNFRGRYGEAIVSAAGPLSNLAMAVIFAIPLRILIGNETVLLQYPKLLDLFWILVYGNVFLGLLNLIPLPPFDGGGIFLSLLPPRTKWQIQSFINQYQMIVILVVFLLGGRVLSPIADAIVSVLVGF
jgi:Zn-dependent protease